MRWRTVNNRKRSKLRRAVLMRMYLRWTNAVHDVFFVETPFEKYMRKKYELNQHNAA